MATWDLRAREEQREMRKSYCLLVQLQSTTTLEEQRFGFGSATAHNYLLDSDFANMVYGRIIQPAI